MSPLSQKLRERPGFYTFESYVSSLSPVNWWKMQETSGNLADSEGSLTLTAASIAAYAQPGPGLAGMNGIDSIEYTQFSTATSGSTAWPTASVYSYCLWAKATNASDNAYLFQFDNNSDQLYLTTQPKVQLHVNTTDFANTGNYLDNAWHFYVVTTGASYGTNVWVDNTNLLNYPTYTSHAVQHTSDFLFSNGSVSGQSVYLCEVAAWNNLELTPTQIRNMWTAAHGTLPL
jgi:hypothetical protein